jgi:hypothetical protein
MLMVCGTGGCSTITLGSGARKTHKDTDNFVTVGCVSINT